MSLSGVLILVTGNVISGGLAALFFFLWRHASDSYEASQKAYQVALEANEVLVAQYASNREAVEAQYLKEKGAYVKANGYLLQALDQANEVLAKVVESNPSALDAFAHGMLASINALASSSKALTSGNVPRDVPSPGDPTPGGGDRSNVIPLPIGASRKPGSN